jgi:aspartate aminotransferase-like enzyme
VIAGGQGKLAGKTLRVGHLGDVDINAILAVMSVLEEVLIGFGLPVTPGAGVAAAERAGLEVAGTAATAGRSEAVAARA